MNTMHITTLPDQFLKRMTGGGVYLNELTGLKDCIIQTEITLTESLRFNSFIEYYSVKSFDVKMNDILQYIHTLTGVGVEDIKGKSRKYELARARKLFMILCVKILPESSWESVSRFIGMANHTSVYHSMKTINREYHPNYKGTKLLVNKICEDWSIDPRAFITYIPNGDVWIKRGRF